MYPTLPRSESVSRIQNLFAALSGTEWDTAIVLTRLNQYYLTGTMQDAVLVLQRSGGVHLFVRRSYERAVSESALEQIHPMESYRDMLKVLKPDFGVTLVETEQVPLAMLERIQKYFPMSRVLPLDSILLQLRSVKSPYELGFMESAGERHHHLLTRVVPSLLQEGISEAEMYGAVYHAMIRDGHQGVTRFNGFGIEMQIGQCSFGTDSLVPTNFDGPGGMLGMAACVPSGGNRDRKLCAGDLVFADTGFGYFGYHTDKTQIYAFAEMLPEKALRLHEECLELERAVQGMLKPRNIPSEIYAAVLEMTGPELSENFMGYQNRKVNFVGHGIGMVINECPVLAKGFDAPLEENMTFAVEPKCGVSGVGMVGVEDTYVVTPGGGRVLTGGGCGILLI